jgi:hypothetical protein
MIKNTKTIKYFVLLLITASLFGCGVGIHHDYQAVANFSASGSKQLAVAVLDQRKYVVFGKESPDYTGYVVSSGIQVSKNPIHTASGNPLAVDMTYSIAASLKNKGFKAVSIIVPFTDTQNKVLVKLKNTDSKRLVLLTLNKWEADAYNGEMVLICNVTLQVFDTNGNVIATAKIVEDEDNTVGVGGFDWIGDSLTIVPKAYKEELEKLFNDPAIVKALQN